MAEHAEIKVSSPPALAPLMIFQQRTQVGPIITPVYWIEALLFIQSSFPNHGPILFDE